MKETVACAAIRLKSGFTVAGKRHHNCMAMLHRQGIAKLESEEQGFMTTRGRFVGRHEGQRIQRDAGIESAAEGGYRGTELYSEDLY